MIAFFINVFSTYVQKDVKIFLLHHKEEIMLCCYMHEYQNNIPPTKISGVFSNPLPILSHCMVVWVSCVSETGVPAFREYIHFV